MCVLGYGMQDLQLFIYISIVYCVHIELIRDLMNQNGNNTVLSVKTPARNSNNLFRNFRSFVHLTLRRLMSYIYIYIYIYMEHPFLMFLDHTQRRSTVGRTPLDE